MKALLVLLWAGAAMGETRIKVGETASIDGVTVKLVGVRPYPGDSTPEGRKATAGIELGTGEAFDIGEYSQNSVYWQGHLISLMASDTQSATLRVAPFTFSWDVSAFDRSAPRAAVQVGKPFVLRDLSITVKALGHVQEYGSYFTLPVELEHQGQKAAFNQGSFNYLGYVFSLVPTGLERAVLEVRPLRLDEKFELAAGTKLEVAGVAIELVGVDDPRGKHRLEYDLRFGPQNEARTLVLPYTEQHTTPPPGKIDSPHREYGRGSVSWKGYELEKVAAGSTDCGPIRRGPFRLKRSTP